VDVNTQVQSLVFDACLWTDATVPLNLDGQRFTDKSLGDP